jgi:hypothetical protein
MASASRVQNRVGRGYGGESKCDAGLRGGSEPYSSQVRVYTEACPSEMKDGNHIYL